MLLIDAVIVHLCYCYISCYVNVNVKRYLRAISQNELNLMHVILTVCVLLHVIVTVFVIVVVAYQHKIALAIGLSFILVAMATASAMTFFYYIR